MPNRATRHVLRYMTDPHYQERFRSVIDANANAFATAFALESLVGAGVGLDTIGEPEHTFLQEILADVDWLALADRLLGNAQPTPYNEAPSRSYEGWVNGATRAADFFLVTDEAAIAQVNSLFEQSILPGRNLTTERGLGVAREQLRRYVISRCQFRTEQPLPLRGLGSELLNEALAQVSWAALIENRIPLM